LDRSFTNRKNSFNKFGKKYSFRKRNLINKSEDGGYLSKVYSLNELENFLVGKFMRKKEGYYVKKISGSDEDASILNYEYEIQKELYENDIKVPKPEGVFLLEQKRFLNLGYEIYFPGLVM
jgi:hypothetical protein